MKSEEAGTKERDHSVHGLGMKRRVHDWNEFPLDPSSVHATQLQGLSCILWRCRSPASEKKKPSDAAAQGNENPRQHTRLGKERRKGLPCLPRFTHHMSVSAKRKSREFRAVLSVARRHKSSQAVERRKLPCVLYTGYGRMKKEISDQAVQTARCKHMIRARKHDLGIFFNFFNEWSK